MKNKGFTLVELLISLSIIVILATIALVYYRSQADKALDARRKADLKRIQVAVEEYEKDHNCYPLPQLVTCTPGKGLAPYINKIPCDPKTNASYLYDYQDSTCPSWYQIYTKLDFNQDTAATPGIGPNSAFNFVMGSANTGSVPQSTPTPAPTGTGGSTPIPVLYYGCKSGVCTQIQWDNSRPGPVCDPSFQNSSCYGQCGPVGVECVAWH